jgi:hypothetical protein
MNKGLVGLAALLVATASHAAPYATASLAVTEHDFGCDACDNDGTGGKLIAGFKLTPEFAIEGSYLNFGKSSDGIDTLKVTGLGLGGAFHLDTGSGWGFIARLGVAQMEGAFDVGDGLAVVDRTIQPYAGVAINYRFSRELSLTGSVDISKAEFGGTDIDTTMFGIGLNFSF